MKKTIAYTFRMDADVKTALERLARQDDRTLASYLNHLLRKHVEDKPAGESSDSKRKATKA